jgi:hypothetical protein
VLCRYEEALSDLEAARQSSPADKAVAALTARVKEQLKRHTAKERKLWAKAFS